VRSHRLALGSKRVKPSLGLKAKGKMMTKALLILFAIVLSSSAFAQDSPPKIGKNPLIQVRPAAPMGCKLVGTVKGTKLWAGDCTAPDQLRGGVPVETSEPPLLDRAGASVPPGQK
jgi:hypothetical protein